MKYVQVYFKGSRNPRIYTYKTALDLIIGGEYHICADNTTNYDNPVVVNSFGGTPPKGIKIREITEAKLLKAPAKKSSLIENVFFNEEKGVTVVLWTDGMRTKVQTQNNEPFDKEKGVALCFMKRVYQNRGYYNDDLKRFCGE